MPSYDFLDKLEYFLRTRTYSVDTHPNSKRVIQAASKHFSYKDGCLWRSYRGRLLKVVRSDEEMREILTRYHDDNNHAGRDRTVKEIMLMYYWVGVTEAVKSWVKSCAVCHDRAPKRSFEPPVQFCLAYGCDASSFVCPELSFHKFPRSGEQRRRWLAVAQRDEGSLRSDSFLCSRHFESSCFTLSDGGQLTLSPDAVPTIVAAPTGEDEVPVPSDDDFLQSQSLEELLSTAAASAETRDLSDLSFDRPEIPQQLQEHQYCLPAPNADQNQNQDQKQEQAETETRRRKVVIEPSFAVYNQIARYLSHRVLPMQSKKSKGALRRMSKRFGLIDGVLMYTRVTPPLRVPRNREEVNSILQQFHDNQGHYGQGICQREIGKHFYWNSMTRDLARWISNCQTCLSRTKRKWLRCSVYNCNNCCGPVERGLGLTFHKFPLHDAVLLAQWLKAAGRHNWHPRLRSSICSTHFTEDCFDRSGEKVGLRPGSVPTLMVHNDSAFSSLMCDQAFFAKYDAVELYLRRRTYPPGLSYVEKNTFRRFCKKFVIKDDQLHMARGERVRLVLRSRDQVEVALRDYHDELNHLDVHKCLRLLNERFFWKTMKADVVQWIDGCSQCSRKKRRKMENQTEIRGPESPTSTRIRDDSDSDSVMDDTLENEDDGGGVDEGESSSSSAPITRTRNAAFVARLRSEHQTNISESRSGVRVRISPQPEETSSRTQQVQDVNPPPDHTEKSPQPPQSTHTFNGGLTTTSESQTSSQPQNHGGVQRSLKRSRDSQVSDKHRPDSPDICRRSRRPQARIIIQQCSKAKVKIKPASDGGDAQWAEIQQGMVVYVCFFHGATEDVTFEMANSLMTTKLFRKDGGYSVSVLDLPGSVLLVHQDSLQGELAPQKRVQYKGGCEAWRGAQLFSSLASACRELMLGSSKCTEANVKVEQSVYGQKQEIVLNSTEPLTLLLEF